ncbi:hypothetical protein ARALYDRAFT_888287 [Arabidopsis lyrata subsp. lyrata]|uniref:Protein TIC 20 n=1 Tax=Arabidopsis lyrata subsp. lyrata TaxID=81972 RepID=D7KKN6_ARALL|nr:hypothetical protein ARALYDRAFT_888287 [Arabidopsis lyrata subsp. lyrata]
MQGLATSTDRISLSFLGPRISAANDFASSLSFAYDRRLPRRVTASADDNSSITTVAENRLQNRLFMVYCCLGFMWMVKNESLPRYFRFHMTMGLLLDALEYLPWININGKLIRMYYTMLVMGLSFTHLLIDFVYWWFLPILVCIAVVVAIIFTELFTLLGFS